MLRRPGCWNVCRDHRIVVGIKFQLRLVWQRSSYSRALVRHRIGLFGRDARGLRLESTPPRQPPTKDQGADQQAQHEIQVRPMHKSHGQPAERQQPSERPLPFQQCRPSRTLISALRRVTRGIMPGFSDLISEAELVARMQCEPSLVPPNRGACGFCLPAEGVTAD